MQVYQRILDLVDRCPVLRNRISDVVASSERPVLDLTKPNWERCLRVDRVFDRHDREKVEFSRVRNSERHVKTDKVTDVRNDLNVLVVAKCVYVGKTVTPPLSNQKVPYMIPVICPPLDVVGEAFVRPSKKTFHESDSKLFLERRCGPLTCRLCNYYEMNGTDINGPYLATPWLCTAEVECFDGQHLRSIGMSLFDRSSFWAILKLATVSRQTYGLDYGCARLCCRIERIMFFDDESSDDGDGNVFVMKPSKLPTHLIYPEEHSEEEHSEEEHSEQEHSEEDSEG